MTILMSHMIEGDSRKGDQEAADLQKRGPRSNRFAKKGQGNKKFGNLCCRQINMN